MKKIIIFFYVMIFAIWSTGCKDLDVALDNLPDNEAKECGLKAIELLNEQDTDGLIALFNEEMQANIDLKTQIESMYTYMDGKIVSYDEDILVGGGTTKENGEIVLCTYSPEYNNVKIGNRDENYYLSFGMHIIDKTDPRQEGIWVIQLTRVDNNGDLISDNSCYIGDPERYT